MAWSHSSRGWLLSLMNLFSQPWRSLTKHPLRAQKLRNSRSPMTVFFKNFQLNKSTDQKSCFKWDRKHRYCPVVNGMAVSLAHATTLNLCHESGWWRGKQGCGVSGSHTCVTSGKASFVYYSQLPISQKSPQGKMHP